MVPRLRDLVVQETADVIIFESDHYAVSLPVAQETMRHSNATLTTNVYTDPALLDFVNSLDMLPALPIDVHIGVHS